MGYVTAVMVGHPFDWQSLAILITFSVLHGIGFGEPVGHAMTGRGGQVASDGSIYESWQFIPVLRENPWIALAFRGGILGLSCVWTLDPLSVAAVAVGWAISFPLSIAIVRFWVSPRWDIGTGEVHYQALCGFLSSSIIILLVNPI